MPKTVKYVAVLIGTFIVLDHFTGSGKVISAATSGGATVIRTLQGR